MHATFGRGGRAACAERGTGSSQRLVLPSLGVERRRTPCLVSLGRRDSHKSECGAASILRRNPNVVRVDFALFVLDDARDALDDAALTERRLTAQLLSLQQELDAAEARSREDHACFDILRREISADDSWLMPMLGKQVHEVAAVQACSLWSIE
eukprot:2046058-Pleurochrysis_carterae.AAC.2